MQSIMSSVVVMSLVQYIAPTVIVLPPRKSVLKEFCSQKRNSVTSPATFPLNCFAI